MMGRQRTIRSGLLAVLLPGILLLSAVIGTAVYSGLYDAILSRFENKLVTTSGLVGVLIDPAHHEQLAHSIGKPGFSGPELEKGAVYRSEHEPMYKVRTRLGLTYLYTQVPTGTAQVDYVLDTADGEEHTTVGYRDELPADTMAGLRAVSSLGRVYLSPIQKQENWGLLKTAAAPIWSPDGRITGSVGADVNIGVIRDSTENALLLVGLIGGISMILGAISISLVVGRLSRPLAAAKLAALQIAAGRTDIALPVEPLWELERLNADLRATADQLSQVRARYSEAAVAFDQTLSGRDLAQKEADLAAA
jgi:hypothetical protein